MSAPRLVLYTGKGGVGKTTTAAATAVCAARRGLRTLVLSADAAHSLGDVLGLRLGPHPTDVDLGASASDGAAHPERLAAVEVDAAEEMGRHWGRVKSYLVSLFRYQGIDPVVADELALLPGAEELCTLFAVEAFADSGDWDLLVVDCAPTDSTLRLVTLPDVAGGALRWLLRIQKAVASVITPVARGLVPVPLPDAELFRDAEDLLYRKLRALRQRIGSDETSVRLVVTPERMVIDEARRAWSDLCLFDVPCDAVVMNRLLPDAAADEPFFRDWGRVQEERRREVAEAFEPLRVLEAPLQDDEVTGSARLAEHGEALFAGVSPADRLSLAPRLRFESRGDAHRVCVPLPGERPDPLDVAVVEEDLVVTAGGRRRAIALPRRLAALPLASAHWREGELVVSFARGGEGPV